MNRNVDRFLVLVAGIVLAFLIHRPASAHDPKLSSISIRRQGSNLKISVVGATSASESLLRRVFLSVNGTQASLVADSVVPNTIDRTVLEDSHLENVAPAAILTVNRPLFPEVPGSKTLVFIYEGTELKSEGMLELSSPPFIFSSGSSKPPSPWIVANQFFQQGITHIFGGPDHVLFVIGLLLLGGTIKRLMKVVTAFTIAHSLTLILAATGRVTLPPALVEPIIALSIVAVGVESLLAKPGGYDGRLIMAFAFGLIHGFGFAGALTEIGLPGEALAIALGAFNLGVEAGQLAIVLTVAPLLALLAQRSQRAARRAVVAGAVAVVLMGAIWFLQRIA